MGCTPFGEMTFEQLCRSVQNAKLSFPTGTPDLWRSVSSQCMTVDVSQRPTPNQLLAIVRSSESTLIFIEILLMPLFLFLLCINIANF